MNDKMKDPECVTRKVKIALHDYSNENFLATFIPQKQLTLEKIFWSQDLIKFKSKALKEQTTVYRPIKALIVYPPNTPATLVPRVLPTKIQVKIHIFTLIQLFSEFDKTCKKRITPTGLTEGERVFSVATNSELNVARFTKMHVANTIVEARCMELEAELANLRNKSHHDNQEELINRFSKLEHYKELYDFIKITRAKHIEQVTALTTKNVNLEAQILKKVNSVSKDHVKPKVLALGKYTIDVELIVPHLRNNRDAHLDYLRHLKESVKTIRNIVKEAKVVRPLDRSIVSTFCYTKHSQELLEYAIGTCPQDSQQRDKQLAHIPLIRKKQVTFTKPSDKSNSNTHKHVAKVNTQKTNVPLAPSIGVNSFPNASGLQPRSNTMKNRISLAKVVNKMPVIHIVLLYMDSGCSKHMTGDRSRLMNFVKKFIGTVQFGNDHFGAIMGYEDYVIGDSVISRVYYVEGLGHNLFFVGQFCDSDLEVAFRKHSCYVRDTDGVKLIKGSHGSTLYTISIEDMMKSSPICLLSKASKNKSWLWHRRLNHMNFGTINCNTPKLARSGILGSGRITSWINNTRYILNDQKVV
nr:integrase, catalytic region, zinc finger, CCHC-type, peptidase aspartic, catalytic [Tanacetum cinerariifolium]